MGAGVFISGTDTNIGKTVVTTALAQVLRDAGVDAIPFKPIQTGARWENGAWHRDDVAFYKKHLDIIHDDDEICPVCYEEPVAPSVAARFSGKSLDINQIATAFDRLIQKHSFVLVEGAGGLAVPITDHGYTMADLAHTLKIPLIIVSRAGLGTINHTVLTVKYAHHKDVPVLGIMLNQGSSKPDLAEQTNPGVILQMTGSAILAKLPLVQGDIHQRAGFQQYCQSLAQQINVTKFLQEVSKWSR